MSNHSVFAELINVHIRSFTSAPNCFSKRPNVIKLIPAGCPWSLALVALNFSSKRSRSNDFEVSLVDHPIHPEATNYTCVDSEVAGTTFSADLQTKDHKVVMSSFCMQGFLPSLLVTDSSETFLSSFVAQQNYSALYREQV